MDNIGTILLWAAYLLLVVIGLFVKSSKVYDASFVIFFSLITWLNTDAADLLDVYMPIYINPQHDWGVEPGWTFLCNVGNALGLTYNGFVCVLCVLSASLLVFLISHMTVNSSFYIALFLVYPGLISIVQFRQFVASVVVMAGIYLLMHEKKASLPAFIFCVLVGFSIHRSSIIMAALGIVPFYSKMTKGVRWILAAIGIGLLVLCISNAQVLGQMVFGKTKTDAYLRSLSGDTSSGLAGNASTLTIALIDIFLTAFIGVFVAYCARKCEKAGLCSLLGSKILSGSNLMMYALIPLLFVTEDFMRFERYGFMLALLVFSMMPYLKKRHMLFSCKAFLLLICCAFAYMYVLRGTTFGVVVEPLLSFEYFPMFLR